VLPFLGNLIVASSLSDRLLQFDGSTGASLGVLPNSVSPDLVGPTDLIVDESGDVFVATSNDAVLSYAGFPTLPYVLVIAPGAGGLTGITHIAISPSYFLFASSGSSNQVLKYSLSGDFMWVFNDEYPLVAPTGLAFTAFDHALVARAGVQPIRIIEYDGYGRYLRSFIRGDFEMTAPNGIVLRAADAQLDCNANDYLDSCDIGDGLSMDLDANVVPDECQIPLGLSPWMNGATLRTLTVSSSQLWPTQPNPPGLYAIRVDPVNLQSPSPPNAACCPPPDFSSYEAFTCTAVDEAAGCARWVGPPSWYSGYPGTVLLGSFYSASLQCSPFYFDYTAWGTIEVTGAEIMPSSLYELRIYAGLCEGNEPICAAVSEPVTLQTRRAGDLVQPFSPSAPSQPNALDVVAAVDAFRHVAGVPRRWVVQTQPNVIDYNHDINALDIVSVVDHFRGLAYPFSGPCPCPSTVICDAQPCSSDSQCSGGLCIRVCSQGPKAGFPCDSDSHCLGSGACGPGFCRDRCGRCRD
jgi:hypothetical protein